MVTANRSFYMTFRMQRQDLQGLPLYALARGQWDILELRSLLSDIAPQHAVMDAFEVEQDFAVIGRRTMLLNARKVYYEENTHTTILLAIEDITERCAMERDLKELLEQKDVLLQEMQHRVGNSLQIIARILLIKAHGALLGDAAASSGCPQARHVDCRDAGAASGSQARRTDRDRPLPHPAVRDPGQLDDRRAPADHGGGACPGRERLFQPSRQPRLIVTDLVLNALKHAFPDDRSVGSVLVAYTSRRALIEAARRFALGG